MFGGRGGVEAPGGDDPACMNRREAQGHQYR
jgi:hypothetical protein